MVIILAITNKYDLQDLYFIIIITMDGESPSWTVKAPARKTTGKFRLF